MKNTEPPTARGVRLVPLPARALAALLDGDLDAASRSAGVCLPPFFLSEGWLWRIRLDQIDADPGAARWIARAVVACDDVVGHAGFHGPPDADGVVEVGYTIVPQYRGRGLGHAALEALLDWAAALPDVHVVRASVRPENTPSVTILRRAGFLHVGHQHDDVDGLEHVYERAARAALEQWTERPPPGGK